MAFHNVPPNGFPDLPDVEELAAVEKDVKALKTTTAEQGAAIAALGTAKAAKADIAPTFSAESSYAVGDLVYYEGVLYECTTEHEAAAWDAEDFTAASIDDELSSLKSGLTNVESELKRSYRKRKKNVSIPNGASGLSIETEILPLTAKCVSVSIPYDASGALKVTTGLILSSSGWIVTFNNISGSAIDDTEVIIDYLDT